MAERMWVTFVIDVVTKGVPARTPGPIPVTLECPIGADR
jgi:hypothetical protein